MVTMADRVAHTAGQWARIGWFFGNALLTARMTRGSYPQPRIEWRPVSYADVLAQLMDLVHRDWQNIEREVYHRPGELIPDVGRLWADARAYFDDLPTVAARRLRLGNAEVIETAPPDRPTLPPYYLQNFHYQTDGYLSDRSARLYDYQVEVLFRGGADMMRRQALAPIRQFLMAEAAADRPVRGKRLLDVACGTGSFLAAVKHSFPWLAVAGLDLSAPYLTVAARRLAAWTRVGLIQAPAEALPLPDASVDLVTCVYLFHELPRLVRERVAAEIARVLTPGGRLVLVDSIQLGDRPAFDGILAYFPLAYHEPYYEDYVEQDLPALFEAAGLRLGAVELAFMSKIITVEKQ